MGTGNRKRKYICIYVPLYISYTSFRLCTSGTFQLELKFTNDYPNKPPHVRFLSKLFHPNGVDKAFLNVKIIDAKNVNTYALKRGCEGSSWRDWPV